MFPLCKEEIDRFAVKGKIFLLFLKSIIFKAISFHSPDTFFYTEMFLYAAYCSVICSVYSTVLEMVCCIEVLQST